MLEKKKEEQEDVGHHKVRNEVELEKVDKASDLKNWLFKKSIATLAY